MTSATFAGGIRALAATIVLACRAATVPAVAATVVFAVCSVELFGVSAVYPPLATPPLPGRPS
jgi:hypothetical protein